jgi:hypothetical protein
MDATLEVLRFSLETMKRDRDRCKAELEKNKKFAGCRLHIQRRGGKIYYYLKKPGSRRYSYAGAKQSALVAGIQRYMLTQKRCRSLEKNIAALSEYIENHIPCDTESVRGQLARPYQGRPEPEHSRMPGFIPDVSELTPAAAKWCSENAAVMEDTEPVNESQLIHPCPGGFKVRSKSEALLVALLIMLGIPFFYELPQVIGGRVFRPDFTIYSQSEDKEYIIEHFGMLTNPDYYLAAVEKICYFASNGLLPDRDVFYTYDGSGGDINLKRIKDILSML